MPTDFDSPWKDALDLYFESFLALLFPEIQTQIDWSRGNESLDKEFQQIVREAELGTRTVDKLVKIWTLDGAERWVLIHVEVQTTPESNFPERMYVYNYRIFDRYNRSVASIAVLADEDPNWRPNEFRNSLFGCDAGIRFPTVKLLDVATDEAALEASINPFAKIVLAHCKAQETQNSTTERHLWKIRLIRGLYERGFTSKDVREIFRLIDWMMELPPQLNNRFWLEVEAIQKERVMPFVSTPERVGRCRGLRKGIEALLERVFGDEGLRLMSEISEIYEEQQLEAILNILKTSDNLEDVRRLCVKTMTPESPE